MFDVSLMPYVATFELIILVGTLCQQAIVKLKMTKNDLEEYLTCYLNDQGLNGLHIDNLEA